MAEPLPAGSQRRLRVWDVADSNAGPATLEMALGDCLRFLPGRREVYQVEAAFCEALVGKRFLPHPRMKRDALREWRGLLLMHENGLPAPKPRFLAFDELDGGLWVLMTRIEGLRPLERLIDEGSLAENEGRAVARQMVCALQRMHSCGLRQKDQHTANWGWDGADLYILDAGTIANSKRSLGEKDRLNDLAHICVTLSPEMERRFRGELREMRPSDWDRVEVKLNRAVERVQRARLRRYDAKTRRNCTEFLREERGGALCLFDRRADEDLLEAFRKDPEALMARGTSLKAGNTCTVVGIEFGGSQYVLKRYNKKPFLQRLRTRGKRSRAMRSWSSSWLLKMAFIPTPRAVGVREEYAKGLRRHCYLLMEALGGELLDAYVATHRDDPEKLALVASQFARIWSALERMRAAHGDFKATNFIVDASGELYLYDLDAFTFNLPNWIYSRRRKKDRQRFMENWSKMPEVARIFEGAVVEKTSKDTE